MIHEKTGSLPFGAYEMSPAELAPHMVELQNTRVELNERLSVLRIERDEIDKDVTAREQAATARAMATLPPGRGKDTPSATAVEKFVKADGDVLAAKAERDDLTRQMADAGDQLGAVRSALRVCTVLVEIAHRKADDAKSDGKDW